MPQTVGPLSLNADPTSALHAATKQYVDAAVAGGDLKPSVRAATTANITLSGAQTIDGVSVVAGDRVLVKNQTTTANNGIYVAAAGSWTRATDMDAWAEVPGAFVTVEEGTANADTGWLCTSNAGGTLGTTAITWTQFPAPSASGWTEIANVTPTAGGVTAVQFTSIPATYQDLELILEGITLGTTGNISLYSSTQAAPSTFSGSTTLGSFTGTLAYHGGILIPNYLRDQGMVSYGAGTGASPLIKSDHSTNFGRRNTGGLGGIQLIPAQNWSAGTFRLMAR